jgi:pyruvyltransferase
MIKSYWWNPVNHRVLKHGNFGDLLTKEILMKLTSNEIVHSEGDGKLVTLGSVMHMVKPNDIVWGTGVNGKCLNLKMPKNNNILNVRGPLTEKWVKENGNEVKNDFYFDPGILVSKLFPKKHQADVFEIGIVPHYSNYQIIKDSFPQFNVINPDANPLQVIEEITKCSMIVSSSLHGIICAESYGIPASYYSKDNVEPDFKYIDYYNGTDREFVTSNNIADCIRNASDLPSIDFNKIIKSFPF